MKFTALPAFRYTIAFTTPNFELFQDFSGKNRIHMGNDFTSDLRKRLESPDARSFLKRLAWAVLRDIEKNRLRSEFPCGADPAEMFEDIRSELILFILENETRIGEYLNQEPLQAGEYIKTAFLNHLRDRVRSGNDFDRLYRLTSRVLKDSGCLATVSDRYGTWFGTPGADRKIHDLADEDLDSVLFPETAEFHEDLENPARRRFLIPLAVYFRDCIANIWEDDRILIPVRDFITWLGRFVPFSGTSSVVSIDELPDFQAESEESPVDPVQIRLWAETAAGRLSPKERRLFLMRHGDGLNYAEIAKQTGYKSPSGPKYPLDNACQTLRLFLDDLPGLNPEDLNLNAFSLFFDFFIKILKKPDSNP